jgi:hypothetical protein
MYIFGVVVIVLVHLILRTAGENNLRGRRQRIIKPEFRKNLDTLVRLGVKEHFI